jgi:hypothetical protein
MGPGRCLLSHLPGPAIMARGQRRDLDMLTNAAMFEKELVRLISEEIERLKELLVNAPINQPGNGSITHLQGAIVALRNMDDLIEEAKIRSSQSNR